MHSPGFASDVSPVTLPCDRLKSRVEQAFEDSGYCALRSIDVRAHEGMVVLDGQVNTYYLKQFAQSLAMQTDGVQQLQNRIEVI